eukprot:TRINITY_DN68398_c0_g1_i1.p1 TRINITY_DN68398_c0_g1~~TRINITY_DN68398_c0_g1_i1.p1  ORF type:complete len:371 (+),score=61.97 TRINITY_DN68398_c0_g1_i1:128-1240(+)
MNSAKAQALEEAYIKRQKKNTYKERRKEGRTRHGQTSITQLILAGLGLLFNIMAWVVPSWRQSWVQLIGYSSRRGWGLFQVTGQKSQWHHSIAEKTCVYFGELKIGNICASPICKWYQLKCRVYTDMSIGSYVIAFVFTLCVIIHVACLGFTFKMTPTTLRWASVWFTVAAICEIGCVVSWWVWTESLFEELDEESVYPPPPPGLAFFAVCIAATFLVINAVLAMRLSHMWPEVDLDSPDWDSEPSESSEEEESEGIPKRKKGPPNAMMGPSNAMMGPGQQPLMMNPGMGMAGPGMMQPIPGPGMYAGGPAPWVGDGGGYSPAPAPETAATAATGPTPWAGDGGSSAPLPEKPSVNRQGSVAMPGPPPPS